MIDLYKLRYFVTVVRAGSFVQAAEELHVSQPALSRSIQSLEKQFGVALLDRGRGGVSLTAVGQDLLHYADDLLYNSETLERLFVGAASGTSGRVAFGIGPAAATVLLPALSARLASEYPEIGLRVVSDSVSDMTARMLNGEIEFFLGHLDRGGQNDRMDVDVLGAVLFRVLAREGHPLVGESRLRMKDLAHFPRLGGTAYADLIQLNALPTEREYLMPTIEIDNYSILHDIALATDAILFTSYGDLDGLVALPVIPKSQQNMLTRIAIYSHSTRSLSPAARTVARTLRALTMELIPMTDARPDEPAYLYRAWNPA